MTMQQQRVGLGWTAGSRGQALERLHTARDWDLIVIGGGITGAGVLREATRRGLRALLIEQRDFAWGTSSRSSKMVHGGLRYLGAGQIGLTRDAVRERERLLAELPGLVERMHYLMPHYRGQFPGPRLMGSLLWAYDRLAGKRSRAFHPPEEALRWAPDLRREGLIGCSHFTDAVTDDARLVLRVLTEAIADGAEALNYLEATEILREGGQVRGAAARDAVTGARVELRAPVVINATGAWTDRLRGRRDGDGAIRPLRGSHLVLPHWRLPLAACVSLLHPDDRRPVFVFPWESVTVVGTTDLDHNAPLNDEARITAEEVDYLLAAVNRAFPSLGIVAKDIQATWAGVRPVVSGGAGTPSKEKREHFIWSEDGLVSVAGGKLTTFRLIAADVLAAASDRLPQQRPRAPDQAPLFYSPPATARPHGVAVRAWRRLLGHYGANAWALYTDDGAVVGTDILWAELRWAAANEAVVHLDDLLLRRSRLGLLLPEGATGVLAQVRELCQPLLGWSDAHWETEAHRYSELWQRYYGVPQDRTDEVSQ